MARIHFVPSKTAVEVREPDGDVGQFPAATGTSAGVMTAQHVQMLEETFRALNSRGGSGSMPVIIERAADTSEFATRAEVTQLLRAMPQTLAITPEMQALRKQILSIQDQIRGVPPALLASPQPGEVVDETARAVLDHALAEFETLDQRLRRVEEIERRVVRLEAIMHALQTIADLKAGEAA